MATSQTLKKKYLHTKRALNIFFVQSLRLCHLPPFNWKLFKLGLVSVRDLRKNVPILQVGGFTLALPIPPVFRGSFTP